MAAMIILMNMGRTRILIVLSHIRSCGGVPRRAAVEAAADRRGVQLPCCDHSTEVELGNFWHGSVSP